MASDNDSEQTLCTVRYVTRSLVKANKTVQENREIRQAFSAPKVTSEPDHVLEGQLAKTKNPQNTYAHILQVGGGEVPINPSSLVKKASTQKSKGKKPAETYGEETSEPT